MRCIVYQATNKGCRVGFFGEGSFYERPAHSRNLCHQLLFFCGAGTLVGTVGCGLVGFGEVAAAGALAGVPELSFEAGGCWADVVADVSVGGVDSSTDGKGER